MAKTIFSFAEIHEILKSNHWIPREILDLTMKGNKACFQLETGQRIYPRVTVSLEFLRFKHGVAFFRTNIKLIPNIISKPIIWYLLQKKKLENYVGLNEYPDISIDLNKILMDKIKGIQVKDVAVNDGLFTITT